MTIRWNAQQDSALKQVLRWAKDKKSPQSVFKLFGYAGTGKTTLAHEIAQSVPGLVLFVAYTGKASLVLMSKGCESVSTIHSLIYRVEETSKGEWRFRLNRNSHIRDAALVIVDEGSMVDDEIGTDLVSFGRKLLVLADPFQLKPPKGPGYFTQGEPDLMLTDVERQAKDNPIIHLSREIRENKRLPYGTYGETKVIRRKEVSRDEVLAADQILVGQNATRRAYNQRVRVLRGYTGDVPNPGERLVCLRNNHDIGLLNGGLWDTVSAHEAEDDVVELVADSADGSGPQQVECCVPGAFFRGEEDQLSWAELKGKEQFTYGHALTVHKGQGSQWPNIYLFDESSRFRDQRWQHLYTGLTRAQYAATVAV